MLAAEAGERLRGGEVGLVPTDTVVGLVAGDSGKSRLAGIKRRDPGKPVAMLCASAADAFSLAVNTPPLAHELARRLWPGPLTLVLDAPEAGGGTVGVRVPDHEATRAVISAHGGPLHATSANLSGGADPQSLTEVQAEVFGAVDFTVVGEAGGGEASAVVDLSGGRVKLLRGNRRVTEEDLRRLAGATGGPDTAR